MSRTFILLIVMTVTAQVSAQSCEFCPGNAVPGNLNYYIVGDAISGGLTCLEVSADAQSYSANDCEDLQNSPYPLLCACPGLASGTCAGICPDGSTVGRPNASIPSEGITCSDYDTIAKSTNNQTTCADFQSSFASFCRCPDVAPACSGICLDGQFLTNPKLSILGGQATCKSYEIGRAHV